MLLTNITQIKSILLRCSAFPQYLAKEVRGPHEHIRAQNLFHGQNLWMPDDVVDPRCNHINFDAIAVAPHLSFM
jgi:hypothetical protein